MPAHLVLRRQLLAALGLTSLVVQGCDTGNKTGDSDTDASGDCTVADCPPDTDIDDETDGEDTAPVDTALPDTDETDAGETDPVDTDTDTDVPDTDTDTDGLQDTGPIVVPGRPFHTADGPTVAPLRAGTGWSDAVAGGETDMAAAAAWARAALAEHASVASFATFTLDLLAVGAPADLVGASVSAMQDEIAHARLCFDLAAALGGTPLEPGPLSTADTRPHGSRAELLVALVRDGCVNETVAAHEAALRREGATHPGCRAALDRIAADESRHAQLAWRTLAWLLVVEPTLRDVADQAFIDAHAATRQARHPEEPDRRDLGLLRASERAYATSVALDTLVAPVWAALRARDEA